MAKLDEKIGFIAGGNMAFAIGAGLIQKGIVKPTQVLVAGPHISNLKRWQDLGAKTTDDNCQVVEKSDIIFICVKPQILEPCATQLRSEYTPTPKDKDKLFISIIAGVDLDTLEKHFSFIEGLKMIRSMPNTPMQIGEGCTVYAPGTSVAQHDLEKTDLMLSSLGMAQQVPEKMIDPISAISGCGPAYVYSIIDAIADGGVKLGVPKQMAIQLAAKTLMGAAKTVLVTGKHPIILKDEVCSPAGSTIAACHELEKGGMRGILMSAVEQASNTCKRLGQKK